MLTQGGKRLALAQNPQITCRARPQNLHHAERACLGHRARLEIRFAARHGQQQRQGYVVSARLADSKQLGVGEPGCRLRMRCGAEVAPQASQGFIVYRLLPHESPARCGKRRAQQGDDDAGTAAHSIRSRVAASNCAMRSSRSASLRNGSATRYWRPPMRGSSITSTSTSLRACRFAANPRAALRL